MLNWTEITRDELGLIRKIATRARQIYPQLGALDLQMDIEATHSNGCPLKLKELLEAENFDFAHDIAGIHNNLNRNTGKLENCFLPRYSA
jgi:hypothetical protein